MILLKLVLVFLQVVTVLLVAPLMQGVIQKMKANLQGRVGPSIFQPYFHLLKLFQKGAVISSTSSWIQLITPYIVFSSMLTVAMLIPLISAGSPLSFMGDIIVVIYLLALARFFMTLAALDAGSSFGGMGSSREMTLSALAEPAMMLSIFTMAITVGSTNLDVIVDTMVNTGIDLLDPTHILAFGALFIVMIAETARIPVDNPDTHLELTMIHEAMLLEFSGKYLALMEWASQIKFFLYLALLANIFFPWGLTTELKPFPLLLSLGILIFKVVVLIWAVVLVENGFAKLRFFRVPNLLGASFVLSLLALLAYYLVKV